MSAPLKRTGFVSSLEIPVGPGLSSSAPCTCRMAVVGRPRLGIPQSRALAWMLAIRAAEHWTMVREISRLVVEAKKPSE